MKTFILTLIATAALCLPAQGEQRTVTEVDSLGRTTRIIELLDTVRNGKAETDTLSITTYDTSARQSVSASVTYDSDDLFPIDRNDIERWGDSAKTMVLLFFLGMFLFFITPVVLIILIFYFRNKNRKQRYLLMQQALAAGQPLPKEVFKEVTLPDNRVKGIKNMALGIGLALFLWMLTDEFSIACIGLLIFCIGAGQLVIYYTTPGRDKDYNRFNSPHTGQSRSQNQETTSEQPTTDTNTPTEQP